MPDGSGANRAFDSERVSGHVQRVLTARRRALRTTRILALAMACLVPSVAHADVRIVRLWTGYKTTTAFVRLKELITGHESSNHARILRSEPDDRTGFYYMLRIADHQAGSLPAGRVVLQVIPPDGVDPVTYRFPFASGAKDEMRIEVGLTGKDWTYGKTMPLAWRLEIQDASGHPLASRQSFLWSEPDPASH